MTTLSSDIFADLQKYSGRRETTFPFGAQAGVGHAPRGRGHKIPYTQESGGAINRRARHCMGRRAWRAPLYGAIAKTELVLPVVSRRRVGGLRPAAHANAFVAATAS
jgi:hypothetical protein